MTTTIDNCDDDPNNSTVGDGYCDDLMNIAECNYDGGDCCGNNVTYGNCSACICHYNITGGNEDTSWLTLVFKDNIIQYIWMFIENLTVPPVSVPKLKL